MTFCASDSFSRSAFHLALSAVRLFLQVGQFLFQPLQPLLGAGIGFLLQRLLLDLQPHDVAVEIVELLRFGIDLHLQPRRGLVDQIDGLVG